MPETEWVNIKINGIALKVPKGEMIIESAKRIGVEIPFFCYHPRLSMKEGGANCRMCLVEVASRMPDGSLRKMPKPQTSCSLPAADGMEIETETEALKADRRGVLEFLLINHPLDCPICDRGGECPLQNNTLHYGPPTTRFIEEKRHFPKAYPLSRYVVFDRERCIHCARCTRFTRDISGDEELNFLWRGADMEVATFDHTEYNSRFSGNVIELCPVGALLSRTYRFKARPWDLKTTKSICTQCSNGCNIKLDSRLDRALRVNARLNEDVNEEWTCDKGKFGMDYISDDSRLKTPMIRRNGALSPASWEEALYLIASELKNAEGEVAGVGGAYSSNEDNYVFQKFLRETLRSKHIDHRMGPNFTPYRSALLKRFGYPAMGNTIAELEDMKSTLIFGSNFVDEQPILYLRVRKGWRFKRNKVVEAAPQGLTSEEVRHVTQFAEVSLNYKNGTELPLAQGLLAALLEDKGSPLEDEQLLSDFSGKTVAQCASETGVDEKEIRKAAELLATDKMCIFAGEYVTHSPNAAAILEVLGDIAVLTGNAGNLNVPVTRNNEQGAMELGILPDTLPGYAPEQNPGMNTEEILNACVKGDLKALWVMNTDLVKEYHNADLANSAMDACPFVVVTSLALTDTAAKANVVLPVHSVAEEWGTFTNVERRVQAFHKAFEISSDIHAGWKVFSDLSSMLGSPMPYADAKDILNEIVKSVPTFAKCGPNTLGDEGVILNPIAGGKE
jgi:NADH-quinone oxidoreductase subunit G